MFFLFAKKNVLTVNQREVVTSGSVNVYEVQFQFDSEWDGLEKTAVFQAGDCTVSTLLDKTETCIIPWEVFQDAKRTLYAGVYGTKNDNVVLPTIWANCGEIKPGVTQGENTQPPTPDVYSQILQVAKDAEDVAQSVRDDADSGKFNGEQGPTGPQGYTYTPAVSEEGVISWTNDGSLPNPSPVNITGPQGETGETPDITAGTVETLEPGQDATAEITGETPNLVLNLGIPKGQPGQDAPQIDDDVVSATNPWSSLKIVDTLAPPFSSSGAIVTCNPVAGYPLHVVSQIVPVQEGSGDPSPDNVRPISGWTEANLWVGGENLWKGPSGYTVAENSVYTNYNDAETVAAVNALPRGVPLYFSASWDYSTGGTEVVWLDSVISQNQLQVKNNTEITIPQGAVYDAIRVYAGGNKTQDATVTDFMFSAGASTTYTPYNPASKTITLPFGQTVYGGTLDWTTGVLTVGWISHTFNAADRVSENWQPTDTSMGAVIHVTSAAALPVQTSTEIPNVLCTSLKTISYGDIFSCRISEMAISRVQGREDSRFVIRLPLSLATTAADIKAWLIDNAVKVAYQIAEPFTTQLTPTEVLALSGTNTIYADTGDTTVSGRADPNAIIHQLAQRIAALEGQAING